MQIYVTLPDSDRELLVTVADATYRTTKDAAAWLLSRAIKRQAAAIQRRNNVTSQAERGVNHAPAS